MQQQLKVSPEEIMQYCSNNFKAIIPVQKNEIVDMNANLQRINRMNLEDDTFAKTSLIIQQNQGGSILAQQQKKIQYNTIINSPLMQANNQIIQPHQQNLIIQQNVSQSQNHQIQTVANQNPYSNNKLLKTFITPFEKYHLQELVEQTEIMIQLLIQNIFLANTESTQQQTYNLLTKMIEKRDQVLARIGQDNKLISYGIPFEFFLNEESRAKDQQPQEDFIPQMSIFQSPLLNILPQMKNLLKQKNNLTKEQIVDQLGSDYSPFINKLYLPTFTSNFGKNSSRSKFTPLDDNLLLQGLTKYGSSQNMEQIRNIFLQEKQTQEIKHRYKNLICSKAQPNPIKTWKNNQYSPLSESEIKLFLKGLKWFGTEHKFNTISKYFFQNNRSGNLLEQEFYNKEKLNKKRKKHNYEVTSVKYNSLLKDFEITDVLLQCSKMQNRYVNKQDSNTFSEVISELNKQEKRNLSPINQDFSNSSEKKQSELNYRQDNQYKQNPQKKLKTEQFYNQPSQQFENNFQGSNLLLDRSFDLNNNIQNSQFNNEENLQNVNNKLKNDFNNNKNNISLDFQSYNNNTSDFYPKDKRTSPSQYNNNNNNISYLSSSNNNKNTYQSLNNNSSSSNNIFNKPSKFKMINNVTYEYDEI
ncbi:hypothetical protein ABPG72_011479 [Tetrahymena utriculariae]